MKTKLISNRGQALILIVFGIVGLVGLTALAVDGGNVYSDRRHAQNAADTAVLAGARALIRAETWREAARLVAVENGYSDGDSGPNQSSTAVNVEVYQCSDPGAEVNCGSYDADPPASNPDAGEYLQVKITSVVDTYFAPVIGIQQLMNTVNAIAHVEPSEYKPFFEGDAVVGLAPSECPGFVFQGNANTIIDNLYAEGGGIFVNSDCAEAFKSNSSAPSLTAPSLCTVGGDNIADPYSTTDPINIPGDQIQNGCEQHEFPPEDYLLPEVDCAGAGTATQVGTVMTPGNYTGTFPPAGVTHLNSGMYCVDGNFRLNAGDYLEGSDVLIVVLNGDVDWNGGAEVHLDAFPEGYGPLSGLLIYLPLSDPIDYTHTVHINGNSFSELTGTILAPAADVVVNGTGEIPTINGQLVGYTVELSGNSDLYLRYDDSENWKSLTNPMIELTK